MKIKTAEYFSTAVKQDQYPSGDMLEIAIVGRSNVGKSSLINKIVNRKGLARISQQPGKTQTINFYLINNAFYLVDLPGYGFARVSQQVKKTWGKMIEEYLHKRANLVSVIQLIDFRHPPTKDDLQMYHWLKEVQSQVIIACTKADKISKGQWQKHLKEIKTGLQADPEDIFIPCSALTGTGIEELRHIFGQLLSIKSQR
ncbi:ribosome biogenesis GTP-binding protein YihA/YsxC [Bacillota bacterium LX-D]|nr:ribosome biogenesis GTP-binding protein YihA/YsxC [Bacillota bacterium LX-D]